jgi:hypothetical protein
MKILRFPNRRGACADVASRITQIETLLTDLRGRQAAARADGRALQLSLERLGLLMHQMARGTERLRRSARRLGASPRRIGPAAPQA